MPTFLLSALKNIFMKLLLSAASQKFLEWLFFTIAGLLVKCTKNTIDDEALARLKEEYFKNE